MKPPPLRPKSTSKSATRRIKHYDFPACTVFKFASPVVTIGVSISIAPTQPLRTEIDAADVKAAHQINEPPGTEDNHVIRRFAPRDTAAAATHGIFIYDALVSMHCRMSVPRQASRLPHPQLARLVPPTRSRAPPVYLKFIHLGGATELTGLVDIALTGGEGAAAAAGAGRPHQDAGSKKSMRNRYKRERHGAADQAGDGGGGDPETKSGDDKTDAGREPAPTTRGAVPQFARDASSAPPASSAPASDASHATGVQAGSAVGAGERPGKQVTFAGGPGT